MSSTDSSNAQVLPPAPDPEPSAPDTGDGQPPGQRIGRERRRFALALLLSLVIHALALNLTFSGEGLGLPGFGFPWRDRRIEAPELQVVLVPARATDAERASTSGEAPAQEALIEQPVAGGPAPKPIAAPAPPVGEAAVAFLPAARIAAEAESKPGAVVPAETAKAPSRADGRDHDAPARAPEPAVVDEAPADRPASVASAVPSEPAPVTVVPPIAESPETAAPAFRDTGDVAPETARLAEAKPEAKRQEETARREEAARMEAARLQAEREEAARAAAARREAQRQEEAARREQAARIEAARLAAEREQAARQEAERQEAARLAAAQLEAQRRQEAARREEEARQEAARLALAQREAQRQEAVRQEEAARKEVARLEAERQEAARLALAQREAQRLEAARQEESARKEAARLDAERQQAERLRAGREEAERREALLRAIGRQLDEEAARREEAAHAARQSPSLPLSLSTARRVRLWGRSDPNVELIRYAEAWARKIHLNTPVETARELAKRPHTHPMVTVAIRNDGSVESVTFVLSSGVAEIDDAIRRIVQSYAPYQAFPPALARDFDVIEIRRTWHFDVAVRLY